MRFSAFFGFCSTSSAYTYSVRSTEGYFFMAFMTLINLVAIILLGRQAFLLLVDYVGQRRRGIKNPVYTRDRIPSLKDKAECW